MTDNVASTGYPGATFLNALKIIVSPNQTVISMVMETAELGQVVLQMKLPDAASFAEAAVQMSRTAKSLLADSGLDIYMRPESAEVGHVSDDPSIVILQFDKGLLTEHFYALDIAKAKQLGAGLVRTAREIEIEQKKAAEVRAGIRPNKSKGGIIV